MAVLKDPKRNCDARLIDISKICCSEYEEQAAGVINNIIEDLKSSKARFLAEGREGTVLLPLSCEEGSAYADAESPLCSSLRSVQPLSTPGGYQVSVRTVFLHPSTSSPSFLLEIRLFVRISFPRQVERGYWNL